MAINKQSQIPVSIIVPVYNAETILFDVLESIKKQKYPIGKIIIIDNKSTDNSLPVAHLFKKKNKKIDIKIIHREKTYGISASYNLGAKLAKSKYFVTIHSDSKLPTEYELSKLMSPILKDPEVVASYPIVVHPKNIWLTYNFWQKCLFATVAGTEANSMNGKLDCYKKETFLKIGGYDEKRFSHFIGTEDADMHHRLAKEGKVVSTKARVIHLHGNDPNYSMRNWIARRRFLAISYGKYLQFHAKDIKVEIVFFLIKPFLAFSTLLAFINIIFILPLLAFPFIYMYRMFIGRSTLRDPRILTLPFINIFLVYYESFWMLKSFLFMRNKV